MGRHEDGKDDSLTSFFTSKSVTEGHPDKLADQVSDAILDEVLASRLTTNKKA